MRILERVASHRAKILQIAERHGATAVRMFGSVPSGREDRTSDLDLLVELVPDASLLDLIAIKQDVEDLLGCRVDVVTPDSLSPYMREDVLLQATPL